MEAARAAPDGVTLGTVGSLSTMSEVHFTSLLAVAAIALLAPLVLGLSPRVWLPAIVVEIVLDRRRAFGSRVGLA